MADEAELDLVMISPNAKPPVCKIMDYGKFIYEQSKKEKEAKNSEHTTLLFTRKRSKKEAKGYQC